MFSIMNFRWYLIFWWHEDIKFNANLHWTWCLHVTENTRNSLSKTRTVVTIEWGEQELHIHYLGSMDVARVAFEMVAGFHDLQSIILERFEDFLSLNLDIRVRQHAHAHGHYGFSRVFFGGPCYGPAPPMPCVVNNYTRIVSRSCEGESKCGGTKLISLPMH